MPNQDSTKNTNETAHKGGTKRRRPLALYLAADLLAAAALLGIFYVTNYMIDVETQPVALPTPAATATITATAAPSPSAATATPAATDVTAASATATATPQPTPTPTVDPNDWRAKFADKFTDGKVVQTETSYQSANINITIKEVKKYNVTCYVADIYVAELKYFRNAFAKKPDVMSGRELTDKVAKANDAIIAINGDHCIDNPGPVVRNGKLYREGKTSTDLLIMNYDGSMQTFSPDKFDMKEIKSKGAYQVWTFSTMLLHNGKPLKKFNASKVGTGKNPRTAIGYFEPGHYCFVVVGGRQKGYSEGYTMEQLAALMQDLGCAVAYNLDGGRSSEMIFLGKMLNQQDGGRRPTTEIIYIADK